MTLPVRTKQNISFDSKLGVYKYGKKKSTRDATSLGSARQLLRALHVTEFIEEMIEAGVDELRDYALGDDLAYLAEKVFRAMRYEDPELLQSRS